MKSWWLLFIVALSSCGGGAGGDIASHGPFDANGNYIEAWADRRPKNAGRRAVVKRAEPKPDRRIAEVKPAPAQPKPRPQPVVVASRYSSPEPAVVRQSAPVQRVVTTVAKPKPRPVVKPKPKPRPKPKAKPKPKPKPLRTHRVLKGDTLYSLSRRYGTTVSAIQKLNGLRGTVIKDGSVLKIPHS